MPVSVAGVIALLYAQVVADMARAWWNEPGASHGLLIPPLAAYIVWSRRRAILAIKATLDLRGLWLVGAGCVLFLIGKIGVGYFLSRISLLVVMAGIVWAFWGRCRLRALAFPLLLLVTMIPPPSVEIYKNVAMSLQIFASDVAGSVAQSVGATVYREGNRMYMAQVCLGVEEACSGLHSLAALTIGSLLLGSAYCRRLPARALLLAAAIPIAIAANVIRVASTAILADYRPEFAMGFYHAFSGWMVFVIGFGLVWATAKGLQVLERTSV